jgi:hypothetical protein
VDAGAPAPVIAGRDTAGKNRFKNMQRLQTAIRHTPVPDIDHGYFPALVQHLVNYTVIADANPVQVFCAGKFVCLVGNRFTSKILNMFKNVGDNLFGDFPEIFFSALLEGY